MLKSIAIVSMSVLAASPALADYNPFEKTYTVSITNVTKGVSFTPVLAATHSKSVSFFSVGSPASEELSAIAEGGDVAPLLAVLESNKQVNDTVTTEGLLGPGETVEFEIDGTRGWNKLSFASMLLPTNDTFVSLNGVALPRRNSVTYMASAYDAGTETNDESCVSIPGPTCGGEPFSPSDLGEGYIYPSPGIHGEADLTREAYNWSGPVAKIVITRN